MNNLKAYQNFYFIGIGGIGMSALAGYFLNESKNVAGYDKTPSPITDMLELKGVPVHFEDSVSLIPDDFKTGNKENILIIYTPAIGLDHKEKIWFENSGFTVAKRSEVLAKICEGKKTIAVAGTHGKTTTAAMLVNLLNFAKIDCYGFIGGLMANTHSNFTAPSNPDCNLVVVEADEYDRSFLKLKPSVIILTSMDSDHLDIYGDHENLKAAYQSFIDLIEPGGKIIYKKGLKLNLPQNADQTFSIGIEDLNTNVNATNISIQNNKFCFEFKSDLSNTIEICLPIPGKHNILNALAAATAALLVGIEPGQLADAFLSFKGIKRRFEFIIDKPDLVYIDDYAHHPEELKQTIETVRTLYPDKKITGIFQPHLYSRTRDHADEFAKSLENLDELILMEIYPAREKPIKGISSAMILEKANLSFKYLMTSAEIKDHIKKNSPEVLITLGAGDIDRLVLPLKNILLKNLN